MILAVFGLAFGVMMYGVIPWADLGLGLPTIAQLADAASITSGPRGGMQMTITFNPTSCDETT